MKKTKEFIALQKEWHQKLKDSGFHDLEYYDNNMNPRDMMYREGTKLANMGHDKIDSTQQYYLDAGKLLHDYHWPNPIERRIWELHAEGVPHRQIMVDTGASKVKVLNLIKKYKGILLATYKTKMVIDEDTDE